MAIDPGLIAILQGMSNTKTGKLNQSDLGPIYDLLIEQMMGGSVKTPFDSNSVLAEYAPNIVSIQNYQNQGLFEENSVEPKILELVQQGIPLSQVQKQIKEFIKAAGGKTDSKSDEYKNVVKLTEDVFKEFNTANFRIQEGLTKQRDNNVYTKAGIRSPDDYSQVTSNDVAQNEDVIKKLAIMEQSKQPFTNLNRRSLDESAEKTVNPGGVKGFLGGTLANMFTPAGIKMFASNFGIGSQKDIVAEEKAKRNVNKEKAKQNLIAMNYKPRTLAENQWANVIGTTNFDNQKTQKLNEMKSKSAQAVGDIMLRDLADATNQSSARDAKNASNQDLIKKIVLMKVMSDPKLLANPKIQSLLGG